MQPPFSALRSVVAPALELACRVATPLEQRDGGTGWKLTAGQAETPFGPAFVADGPPGILRLSFIPISRFNDELAQLRQDYPAADIRLDDRRAAGWIRRVFAPKEPGTLPVYLRGTPFQIQVWTALLEIPFGQTWSYGGLATRLGLPKAARAVGSAVGQNKLGYLIPCHRVIYGSGAIGYYGWGPELKKSMLAWETARLRSNSRGPEWKSAAAPESAAAHLGI